MFIWVLSRVVHILLYMILLWSLQISVQQYTVSIYIHTWAITESSSFNHIDFLSRGNTFSAWEIWQFKLSAKSLYESEEWTLLAQEKVVNAGATFVLLGTVPVENNAWYAFSKFKPPKKKYSGGFMQTCKLMNKYHNAVILSSIYRQAKGQSHILWHWNLDGRSGIKKNKVGEKFSRCKMDICQRNYYEPMWWSNSMPFHHEQYQHLKNIHILRHTTRQFRRRACFQFT